MATTDKKNKGITKKIPLKPIILMRVRCKNCHAASRVPWLRRLYVIWAAPPPAASGGTGSEGSGTTAAAAQPAAGAAAGDTTPAPPPKPNYALVQSNKDGYLCPPVGLDPQPDDTLGMFPDHEYWFYFVRHPDDSLPKQILADLNEDPDKAAQTWGAKPIPITPTFQTTGKNRKGQTVQEGVIEVEEDSSQFVPKGSDLYKGWVLFRDMPGTGVSSADRYQQCPLIAEQVRRLQYHLGALRYPVGNQWHPYSPEPWTPNKERRKKGLSDQLYPNEGWFDAVTWNAVLAFQRNANAGEAVELDPSLVRTQILSGDLFDPPEDPDWRLEYTESALYQSNRKADPNMCFGGIPKDYYTIVELNTGDTIRTWLRMKLRKPGKILVAYGEYDSWMREDAYPAIQALDTELRNLGVRARGTDRSVRFVSTFRDIRMSVDSVGRGQKKTSNHKSGLAFDFLESDYAYTNSAFPLYYVRDETVTDKVRWIVYAPVEASKVQSNGAGPLDLTTPKAPKKYVEYVDSIEPWVWDPTSPTGGAKGPPKVIPGPGDPPTNPPKAKHVFLNFTKVCEAHGLKSIPSRGHWMAGDRESHTLDSTQHLTGFVNGLSRLCGLSHYAPAQAEVVVDGTQKFALNPRKAGEIWATDLDDLVGYLGKWLRAFGKSGATPEVTVKPWTKEGEKMVRLLRAKAFQGCKAKQRITGWYSYFVPELPVGSSSVIDLGPGAQFPPLLEFELTPITSPVVVAKGMKFEFPHYGDPADLEWWHFQYEAGFERRWADMLASVGWTREGLLGKGWGGEIFGNYGIGYTPSDLSSAVQ